MAERIEIYKGKELEGKKQEIVAQMQQIMQAVEGKQKNL